MQIEINLKNIKTTVAGLAALVVGILPNFGIHLSSTLSTELIGVLTGFGLMFAKDAEKEIKKLVSDKKE
ncbi:MAG: hypothetical protein QW046_05130 [Candidatus Micrarchaeaceae archaeon]|nr:hypothetical protein [Candidatus Rehaiarchaeum fermentans]